MVIKEVVLYSIFSVFIFLGLSQFAISQGKKQLILNNDIIIAKAKTIHSAVENYCLDDSNPGQPTLDLLLSSNHLVSAFDNDSGYGTGFTLDWTGFSNKGYKLTTYIKDYRAAHSFQNNFKSRVFGTIPTCVLDSTNPEFGKCDLIIPLTSECI